MLSTNYNYIEFAIVTEIADFYKRKEPEINKIRGIIDNIGRLYHIPKTKIQLWVGKGERIYKIIILSPGVDNYPVAWFVYIPGNQQLDLYSREESGIPLIQWKNKKAVFKNLYAALSLINVENIFRPIINLT